MWDAFVADERPVLLIDEIDKADIEFPNDLLQELDRMEFFVYAVSYTHLDVYKRQGLNDALMYNRRLWTIFIDTVNSDANKLPKQVRDNLTRLGVFIMAETFSMMTKPKPNHLKSMIKVNRSIAAGLRGNV